MPLHLEKGQRFIEPKEGGIRRKKKVIVRNEKGIRAKTKSKKIKHNKKPNRSLPLEREEGKKAKPYIIKGKRPFKVLAEL